MTKPQNQLQPMNWPNKVITLELADRLIRYAQVNGVRHLLDAGDVFELTRVEISDFITTNARYLPPVPHGLKPTGPSAAVFDAPLRLVVDQSLPIDPPLDVPLTLAAYPAAPAVLVVLPPVHSISNEIVEV